MYSQCMSTSGYKYTYINYNNGLSSLNKDLSRENNLEVNILHTSYRIRPFPGDEYFRFYCEYLSGCEECSVAAYNHVAPICPQMTKPSLGI